MKPKQFIYNPYPPLLFSYLFYQLVKLTLIEFVCTKVSTFANNIGLQSVLGIAVLCCAKRLAIISWATRIQITITSETRKRIRVICDRSLHFPGIETYRQHINRAIDEQGGEKLTVIADMERVLEVDYTSLKVSRDLISVAACFFFPISRTQTKTLAISLFKVKAILEC